MMNRLRVAVIVVGCVLGSASQAAAVMHMPAFFSRHMVLQRDMPVPVWGWAEANEKVTVEFAGQKHEATADVDGRWQVRLDKLPAGGPHKLFVQGLEDKLIVEDVYVGEVWLASGQSNMVHIMPYCRDFQKELEQCDFPQLRIFTVGAATAHTPRGDCAGQWRRLNRDSLDDVSSVAYFFGKELQQRLGVPVGIVVAALGSTPVEAWTSVEAQRRRPELNDLLAEWDAKVREFDGAAAQVEYDRARSAWRLLAERARERGDAEPREPKAPIPPRHQPQHPGVLYNGMIAPLVPYAFRGVVWYQGEYNTQSEEYAALYRHQLPLLIQDWRTRFGRDDLPFAWVQLPNFDVTTRTPVMPGWPTVREGMRHALAVPHTGMAVTIDLGEADSVHPIGKQDFAHRLALWARAEVYGESVPWSGPLLSSHKSDGTEMELRFRHADGGLTARGGWTLKGFEIAGADRQWRPAKTQISGDVVRVSHPDVSRPAAVRYAWAANPDGNLVNAAGLPASPFTTD